MSGGSVGVNTLDIVEMFNLQTMSSCVVDVKLDQPRRYHTGDGHMVCGGYNGVSSLSSCYNITSLDTINLIKQRDGHISWSTDNGLYLVGGFPSSNLLTTELITEDSTQAGFPLKYRT